MLPCFTKKEGRLIVRLIKSDLQLISNKNLELQEFISQINDHLEASTVSIECLTFFFQHASVELFKHEESHMDVRFLKLLLASFTI